MIRGISLVGLASLLLCCASQDPSRGDGSPGQRDLLGSPEGNDSCGPGIYPCGPYGMRTNEVARNLEFLGYQDPEEQCKDHPAKALDLTQAQLISFRSFYLGDQEKSCQRKLLWVMVGAGWCPNCKTETQTVQPKYASGGIDSRVALLNIVFETEDTGDPATDAFLRTWIGAFGLTFPTVMDPSFKMGAYFTKDKAPFNMLIDLSNMKIIYQQPGGDLDAIEAKINAFLNP